MPYAFLQDVPATEPMYHQVRRELGPERPEGLIAHVVMKRERGLRYIDVWESQQDWERFRDERLEGVISGVLAEYGIPHDHSQVRFEDLEVIDTWLGPTTG